MKLPRLKTLLLIPVFLFSLIYIFGVITVMQDDRKVTPLDKESVSPKNIAIFGASGTAGDGILKAAMASSDIKKIHIITRRVTARMEQGVKSGKAEVTIHKDYLDYQPIIDKLVEVDAVYWAIGINSIGVDEKTYAMIHVDFPMRFTEAWLKRSQKESISFHYISSSDISDDSTVMWAREKRRAEKSLFAFAEETKMQVIAYRPDYIGATEEEAHLGQYMLYYFFAPIGAAVKAEQIGQAMLEVTARENEFSNGDKLHTSKIIRYNNAYEMRQ